MASLVVQLRDIEKRVALVWLRSFTVLENDPGSPLPRTPESVVFHDDDADRWLREISRPNSPFDEVRTPPAAPGPRLSPPENENTQQLQQGGGLHWGDTDPETAWNSIPDDTQLIHNRFGYNYNYNMHGTLLLCSIEIPVMNKYRSTKISQSLHFRDIYYLSISLGSESITKNMIKTLMYDERDPDFTLGSIKAKNSGYFLFRVQEIELSEVKQGWESKYIPATPDQAWGKESTGNNHLIKKYYQNKINQYSS